VWRLVLFVFLHWLNNTRVHICMHHHITTTETAGVCIEWSAPIQQRLLLVSTHGFQKLSRAHCQHAEWEYHQLYQGIIMHRITNSALYIHTPQVNCVVGMSVSSLISHLVACNSKSITSTPSVLITCHEPRATSVLLIHSFTTPAPTSLYPISREMRIIVAYLMTVLGRMILLQTACSHTGKPMVSPVCVCVPSAPSSQKLHVGYQPRGRLWRLARIRDGWWVVIGLWSSVTASGPLCYHEKWSLELVFHNDA
jgi:hypothetical protein